MAEQHLDLLQFPSGRATELRAGTTQVVWRERGDADFCRVLAKHLPDDFFAKPVTGNTIADHWSEDMSQFDSGWSRPKIDRKLHPVRHRRRSEATVLTDEIDDAPAAISLLDVGECERGNFGAAESAAEENGDDGPIAQPANRRHIWRAQKRLRLPS